MIDKPRILITDDSPLMRTLIRNALENAGYQIVGEAANGREAVELYARLAPDLVTMDLVMPVMGGAQAIREIRTRDPQARILVITSLTDKLRTEDVQRLGAMATVTKPYKNDELLMEVKMVLRKNGA